MLKPSAPQGNQRYSLVVVVRVTTLCPMACQYCGYSREVMRDRRTLSTASLARFGHALQQYRSATGRKILVCWLGGEPYLWPDLWPVTQLYSEEYKLPIGVTTSAVNLDIPAIQRNTLRWIDELTISVDGLAEHHEWARQSPGTWPRLRRTVQKLAKIRADFSPILRANLVLMRSNIDQFAAICRELATWGFDELTFNQLGGLDRPEFYPHNRILPAQWPTFRSQLTALRSALGARGLVIAGSDAYLDRLQATTMGNTVPVADCLPGQEFWFIDELGRLSPCSYTSHTYSLPIDELTAVQQLLQIPDQLKLLRQRTLCQACTDCHATHWFDKFRPVNLT